MTQEEDAINQLFAGNEEEDLQMFEDWDFEDAGE